MIRSDFVSDDPTPVSSVPKTNGTSNGSPRDWEIGMSPPKASESVPLHDLPAQFPLVGRASEIRRVNLHLVPEGSSATVGLLIRGEAGVGKTRLI